MAAEPRPESAAVELPESEEHRRFIEQLREGYEDVKAERLITSKELERALEEALARRLARRSGSTPAK